MDLFSVDLTPGELQLLRQSLEIITITGKDAKFVASLQSKLEYELSQISQMMGSVEKKKAQDLEAFIAAEARKEANEKKAAEKIAK